MDLSKICIRYVDVLGWNRDWIFRVGLLGDRWIGVAQSQDSACPYVHFAPEISEDLHLGVTTQAEATRRLSAVMQDDQQMFGPVTTWVLPPEKRIDPETVRCVGCQALYCDGVCHAIGEILDDVEHPI